MKAAFLPRLRPIRTAVAAAGCWALGWAQPMRAENPIPEAFKPDRYEKMAAHSPFTPPTEQPRQAPTPPPAPKTSFADRLSVTMLMEDHAVYYATVIDPDNQQHLYLSSDKEDETTQHMRIESVQWAPGSADQPGVRGAPTITIRKAGEVATVRYEPGGAVGGGAGGVPNGGLGGIAKPYVPNNPGLRPPGGPAIPGSATGGLAVAPQVVPPTSFPRRAPIRSVPIPAGPAANGVRGVVLPGGSTAHPATTNVDDDDDDE